MYLQYPIVIILSSTISLSIPKINEYCDRIKSPTLDQPIENLSETQTKILMEKIFIDEVKQQLENKN